MTVVLAAAGTGGHVYPALAIAEALIDRGVPASDITVFGGDRLETEAVPTAGLGFASFDLPRLQRSLSPRNLTIPWRVWKTATAMRNAMRGLDTRVVVGMSGYATVPAALAADRAAIPFFVQEQNSSPGLAARFGARRARSTYLGLPGDSEDLPRSRVVGNPLRRPFREFDRGALRAAARERYGADPGTMVLGVLGGSLGAGVLNDMITQLIERWEGPPITVVHVAGPEAASDVAPVAAQSSLPWRCLSYEDRMEMFYAAADLIVCRAGAMTVSEAAATGTPAIFVPLERVGQQGNAAAMEMAGGAEVIAQADVALVPDTAARLLGSPAALMAMADAARAFGRPDAAGEIAAELLEVIDG